MLESERRLLVGGAFELEPILWCTVEAGHSGLHYNPAQGLSGGELVPPSTVWLRWPEADEYGPERELLPIEHCPAKHLAGTLQEELCGLPEGHEGRHSFEFGPPAPGEDFAPPGSP